MPDDADDIRRRARAAAGDGLQADLPVDATGAPIEAPGPPPQFDDLSAFPAIESLSGIGTVLGWILLAVVVTLVVVLLARVLADGALFSGFSRRDRAGANRAARGEASTLVPEADSVPDYLREATRLGAEGAYEEGVHLLLLGTIRHLGESSPASVHASHTSRELTHRLQLDGARADAFRHLVQVVERSLFGGRPVTRDGFDSCHARAQAIVRHAGGEDA